MMPSQTKLAAACAALSAGSLVQAIALGVTSPQSIKAVAAQIAGDALREFYLNAPIQGFGQLAKPYYWWEAGAFWGSMVTYSAYTGDDSVDDVTGYAILSQLSPTVDFMMPNERFNLGNDDQVVWALTAMEAAEHNFPIPSANQSSFKSDVWLTAAKNAFTDISKRWDTSTCNGGIRWQIYPENNGYTYKSSIANGGTFQLAARLAHFTGDPDGSYQKFASQIYTWMKNTGLIATFNDVGTVVFDGASTDNNCASPDKHRWTYNAAAIYLGAEMLASLNKQSADSWGPVATSLLKGMQTTFLANQQKPGVLYELNCETYGSCNTDQLAFKSLGLRWLNKVTSVSPASYNNALINMWTKNTALAAAAQCVGGSTKTLCGSNWISGSYDGTQGVGQQISALEAVQGLLVSQAPLVTANGKGKREASAVESAKFGKRGLTARDYMEMSNSAKLRL